MAPTLSICIPTLNRCDFLCGALKSIFDAAWDHARIEVCISNNASEHDYAALDRVLASAPPGLRIRYQVHPRRLSPDENMFAVRSMATADHIYFLGDDDYFLAGQPPRLLELIDRESPDLAIFNGTLVDGSNRVIGTHFTLPATRYPDALLAFRDLRDKGMFGAVLVKAAHLKDEHFKALFGTSHGYGCYWFSLLDAQARRRPAVIMIPDFPLVALRMAAKSYSMLDVYYRQIPYEIAVYRRHLAAGGPQEANLRFERDYFRKISSFVFLAQMRLGGVPIKEIKDIYPDFYQRHAWKIRLSDLLVRSGAYEHLKRAYKRTLKGLAS